MLQLVTGAGPTGECLARSAVNKIAFTGSAATAKKVMAACAENLTPMVAECGGKDALVVGADADLDAAADAAAWGALSNAGQTCVGIERVYVAEDVYHSFLEKLADRMAEVRPGEDREADYGPMTRPGQIDVIERHIADALARGGRSLVGGLASIRKPFVGPVLLTDVPEESRAVTEETFGPTVTVTRVADLDRGRPAGQPQPLRPGRLGVRPEQEGGDGRGAVAAQRDDRGQLGDLVRQRARAAVRRVGRLRVRPHPRRRRAPRVRPAEVDHPAADEAAGQPDLVYPHRPGHAEDPQPGHHAARAALPMTVARDAVVIGGGHNGLVAAAYLARSGLSTLVCERRGVLGGAAVSEHPFGPDYTVTSLSYVVSLLPPALVADLRLARHGYHVYPQGPYFAPRADGRYLSLPADPAARRAQIAKFSARDAASYERYYDHLARLGAVLGPLLDEIPPRLGSRRPPDLWRQGLLLRHLRKLDERGAVDVTRLLTGSIADLVERYFESDAMRGAAVGVRGDRHLGRAPVERHRLRDAAPPHRRHRRAGGRVGLPARRHGRGHRGAGRRGPLVRRRDSAPAPRWPGSAPAAGRVTGVTLASGRGDRRDRP